MFDSSQLAALLAVVEEGTFEHAATALSVTPSAISQRIKALERQIGQVLVTRTRPCRPTTAGEVLLRHARQVHLLETETRAQFGGAGDRSWVELPVVVNADSLATWFTAVLDDVAGWPDVALQVSVEDQDLQARRLRAGEAVAAVTALDAPVQGCSVTPLGQMTYRPLAHRSLLPDAAGAGGAGPLSPAALAQVPMVRFGPDDDLQHHMLLQAGVTATAPVHLVPSSEGFLAAVRAGLGWGMLPAEQLTERDHRELVPVLAGQRSVPLYWQRWRIQSPTLERLTEAVRRRAAEVLSGF